KICLPRRVTKEGDCFAKAHISTAQAPSRQDARISLAHEDRRRPQGSCVTPQEGTPSPYARVNLGRSIRAKSGSHRRRNLTPSIAPGSAARVPISPFLYSRTICRKAGLASVSRKPWVARLCAIGSGGACARSRG